MSLIYFRHFKVSYPGDQRFPYPTKKAKKASLTRPAVRFLDLGRLGLVLEPLIQVKSQLCQSLHVKSVLSTLSHLISTSVPPARLTRFIVEHGLFQYYS